MATLRPAGRSRASSDDDFPERRLPLRWLVIVLVAGLAAIASYPVGGTVAAVAAATAVSVALHKMID